jgi:hypothetical protein
VERRKHWWNGTTNGPARRDVLMFEDGGRWWVELRGGDGHRPGRRVELPDEDLALDCARDMINTSGHDGWVELPVVAMAGQP